MHSPTYKHGHYTKVMQIKLFIALKSIEIALQYTKQLSPKRRQKFDIPMELKVTTLLLRCFYIIAMYSVCYCSLPV